MAPSNAFSEEERATLHAVAEMFQDKDDRDELRQLLSEGATLSELVTAYKSRRWLIAWLKAAGGLIVLGAAVYGALQAFNPFGR